MTRTLSVLAALSLPASAPLLAQQPNEAKYHVFTVEPGRFSDHYVFLDASKLSRRRLEADESWHLSSAIDPITGTSDRKVYGPAVLQNWAAPPTRGSLVYPAIGNPRLASSMDRRRVPIYTLTGEGTPDGWRDYAITGWTASLTDSATGAQIDVTQYLEPVREHGDYLKTVLELPKGWTPGLYDLDIEIPGSNGAAVYHHQAQHSVGVFPSFRSPYKFVVLSDIHIGHPILSPLSYDPLCLGDAVGSKDYHVADLVSILDHLADHERPDFVVITGDFVNGCSPLQGTSCYDAQYQAFKWALLQSKLPVFVTPGNHDQGWPGSERHIESFRKWINPAFNSGGEDPAHLDDFSFNVGSDHFVVIDSGAGGNELDGLTSRQLEWMRRDARRFDFRRTFFVSHAPVVTLTLGLWTCNIPGANMSHQSPNDYHFAKWILKGPAAPRMAAFIAGHTHKAEAYRILGLLPGSIFIPEVDDRSIWIEAAPRAGTRETSSSIGPVLLSASATFDGSTDNPHPLIEITDPPPGAAIGDPTPVTGTAGEDGADVRVELSGDGGFTWHEVAVTSGAWSGTVDLTSGDVIMAKALSLGPVSFAPGTSSNASSVRVAPATYRVSGRVSRAPSGVMVCAGERCGSTDASGNYTITGLVGGTHLVKPSWEDYTFSPAARLVTIGGADAAGINFRGRCGGCGGRSISGSISPALAGVTVSAGLQSAITDSSGGYRIYGLTDGTYSVVPVKDCSAAGPGYAFNPPSRTVTLENANALGQDFAAAEITYGVSGNVGPALAGVEVCAASACATTDAAGNYTVVGLSNGSYTLTAAKPSYVFEPATRSVTIACGSVSGQDFVGRPAAFFEDHFDTDSWGTKWTGDSGHFAVTDGALVKTSGGGCRSTSAYSLNTGIPSSVQDLTVSWRMRVDTSGYCIDNLYFGLEDAANAGKWAIGFYRSGSNIHMTSTWGSIPYDWTGQIGQWYDFVVSADTSGGTATVTKDGLPVASWSFTEDLTSNAHHLRFSYWALGAIDDVVISGTPAAVQ